MFHFSLRRLSLAQQFVFVSLGLVSVILIGVLLFMTRDSVKSKNDQLTTMAQGRASSVIEKIDRNFYERFGDVQAFAFNQLARECVAQNTASPATLEFINTMVSYYVLYDLMMIVNAEGKVIAVNTLDKTGASLATGFLLGKDFSNEAWFQACMAEKGPEGGAWYSDFIKNDDVTKINRKTGWGMAFAAPIRDEGGTAQGVWYNFANWQEVTGGIRKETENALVAEQPGSFILITNEAGSIIDADEEDLLLNAKISYNRFMAGENFAYNKTQIGSDGFIAGAKKGTGAYTYRGKNWTALAFIPKTKLSFSYVVKNMTVLLVSVVIVLFVSAVILYRFSAQISKQLTRLKDAVDRLSKGELVEIKTARQQNEMGQMTESLRGLVAGMKETARFAAEVGQGNLGSNFQVLSDRDELGHALLNMRSNLQTVQVEEQKRNWANVGLAQFSELLRKHQHDTQELCNQVIARLVKYVSANQGMMYLVKDEDGGDSYLELMATYAWDRKKFVSHRINPGAGLAGQCWLEKQTLYLTEVPKDFVKITSGLGQALPGCVAIVPLKTNDEVLGIVEIASFQKLEPYQLTFLEQLGESIAATLASVRANEKTKHLLQQAQQQAEELKSQEEEMRQNMEELTATQEEISRRNLENNALLTAVDSSLAVVEFDAQARVLKANQNFLSLMEYSMHEVQGEHHRLFVNEEAANSEAYRTFWKKLLQGEASVGEFMRKTKKGKTVWIRGTYSPQFDNEGRVTKVIKVAYDITAYKNSQPTLASVEAR